MTLAIFALVFFAPVMLLWDVLHDCMAPLQSYLGLWLACLSIVMLIKA